MFCIQGAIERVFVLGHMGKSLIKTSFKILSTAFKILSTALTLKTCQLLREVCFVYFKCPWKTPGKRMKKVLENPGFFRL
jgi:hypothetical protein